LLSGSFGFGALELRLVSVASDEELRERISDQLARVVTLFGADLQRYGELAAQLEARELAQRRRERFLKLGRAVEDAVAATLTALGL